VLCRSVLCCAGEKERENEGGGEEEPTRDVRCVLPLGTLLSPSPSHALQVYPVALKAAPVRCAVCGVCALCGL
jgi:hypothetical protein